MNNPIVCASVADLLAIADPDLNRLAKKFFITDYSEWITHLYEDIDIAITRMQNNANYYDRAKHSEDSLTHHLINPLHQAGYNASHDLYVRGHADITISYRNFIWLGEAKIFTNYVKLLEGYQQLTRRYSSGDANQNQGGVIIYHYPARCTKTIQKWRNRLIAFDKSITTEDCSRRRDLAFFSTQIHESSGLNYRVRHFPVILYYQPTV